MASQPRPRVTREALQESLTPPNTCRVAEFLATLDPESRAVVEEGLGYPSRTFPANALRALLLRSGFDESQIPSVYAIQDHRNGRHPCRCRA
jgi:hypothetical protein